MKRGACSIDCGRCPIHLRTKAELDYWKTQNVDLNTIRCDGCRSDRGKNHWSPDCPVLGCCVYQKKLDFCSECPDFPCQILKRWADEAKHHKQALKRLYQRQKNRE